MKRSLFINLAITVFSLTVTSSRVFSQSTYSQVYQILQANCSTAGCHDAQTQTFDVTVSESALYSALINATPSNSAAASRGDKLVTPGYVDRSFLLRKISHGISDPLKLDLNNEGEYMPKNTTKLPDNEIELVRQWILFGAPQSGIVIDTALINSYYAGNGLDDTYPSPEPPAPGEGFQMYVGRIFMVADTEAYYFIKFDPRFTEDIEIPKVITYLPASTHHFVIYKFLTGGENNYRDGLRFNDEDSHADVSDGIGTGNNKWEYILPQGTAYYWESNTVLDFNLHIFNYHRDKIMSCELYINIYTQPVGTADDYMLIRNFPVFDIEIPHDPQNFHNVTEVADEPDATHMWKIWQLYSHTHRYGTDYDIYLRKPDGSKGMQVYEGWWSYEQGYNVGYYRNGVEATFRYFPDDALLEVDPRLGFIHEAQWKNTHGPDPILWGLTSAEEMMVMGFQYVKGSLLTSLDEKELSSNEIIIFPNPAGNIFTVNYAVKEFGRIEMSLIDLMGERAAILLDESATAGAYSLTFSAKDFQLADGVYFVRSLMNGKTFTQKLILLRQ